MDATLAARLRQLARLPPDWDSYGARPPAAAALHAARRLGAALPAGAPPPGAVPLADGGLQLEWHLPRGEIAVVVAPAGALEVDVRLRDDGATRWLAALLAELAGREE